MLGVDRNKKSIEAARERAARENLQIDFLASDFLKVPDGKFDIILLLSALHYAENPKAVLRRVSDLLATNGVFILECGVADQAGRRMRRALRAIDERYFPSMELLRDDWLDQFSIRPVGRSVPQAGDPIPRTATVVTAIRSTDHRAPAEIRMGRRHHAIPRTRPLPDCMDDRLHAERSCHPCNHREMRHGAGRLRHPRGIRRSTRRSLLGGSRPGERRPVRPHVGADQAALGADHPRAQRAHRRFIRQPVGIEHRAVMAPPGLAVDEQLAAAVRADMAEGDGCEGFTARDCISAVTMRRRHRSWW